MAMGQALAFWVMSDDQIFVLRAFWRKAEEKSFSRICSLEAMVEEGGEGAEEGGKWREGVSNDHLFF